MFSNMRTVSMQPSENQFPTLRLHFVSQMSATPTIIMVRHEKTIWDLKTQLCYAIRLQPGNISLIYNTVELLNEQIVGECGIPDGATVNFVVRMATSHAPAPKANTQILNSLRQLPAVRLPNLPENGLVARRDELRTNARTLMGRGCAGLVIIRSSNGEQRVVMLNAEQLAEAKRIRAARIAQGHQCVGSGSNETTLHAMRTILGNSSSTASDVAEQSTVPAIDTSTSEQPLVSGDSKMTDLLAKIRASKQAHADRMANISK